MPRIAKLNLDQVNKQVDKIDTLTNQVAQLQSTLKNVQNQTSQLDYVHARPTFNNITFTWTGGTTTLSWNNGWIKDKNAVNETGVAYSQSPTYGFKSNIPVTVPHNMPVTAGSIGGLTANAYYWLAWDSNGKKMHANTDITQLYTKSTMQVICQVFTGTGSQSGTAGGGGSQGGSDLSGARYKLF